MASQVRVPMLGSGYCKGGMVETISSEYCGLANPKKPNQYLSAVVNKRMLWTDSVQ